MCFKGAKQLRKLLLSHNLLTGVVKRGFEGLDLLQLLNLDHNIMEEIPTSALSNLPTLQNFSINGNSLTKLGSHDFQYFEITEISLNNSPLLYSVDKESFFNLQLLVVLEMHDNNKLTYLDPLAFVQCPMLKKLYLHNNNL